MHQIESWVLMGKLSFTIPIFGRTSFSENLMLSSELKLTLNSFQNWFSGFYIKCWVGRCKIIFFADAQPVQNFFSVMNWKLTCFQLWFKFMGIRCSVESGKVKPSFSNWISERTTFFRISVVWHCSMNVYLFSCMVFVFLQTFYQNFSWVGVEKSFSMCFCEEKFFSEASFPALLAERFIFFQMSFLKMPKLWHHLFNRVRRSENIFWMLICERKIFQHCTFVLGIARHTFNCFPIKFLGRPQVVYLLWLSWPCKTIFRLEFANEWPFRQVFLFKTVCN